MTQNKPSIVILKSAKTGLKQPEDFLINREWPFKSTSSLPEAVNLIKTYRPVYVLVPVDHPNKAVVSLPDLLRQAFGATVITYTERTSAASLALLVDWKMTYNLFPPISGPSILRMISKIENDRAREARDLDRQKTPMNKPEIADTDIAKALLADLIHSNEGMDTTPAVFVAKGPGRSQRTEVAPGFAFEDTVKASLEKANKKAKAMLGIPVEKLELASRIGCMIVKGKNFSGYLVVATGENRSIDSAFFGSIRRNLYQFLESRGEVLSHEANELLDLSVETVEFVPWAKQKAEFLLSTVHGADEIAMAFFPVSPVEFEFQTSARPEMVQVHIDDIEIGKPLEFDIYLYLSANDKYVLYNKQGGVFEQEQKERLTLGGVRFVHLKREAEIPYLRHKAQRFFNQSIMNYSMP